MATPEPALIALELDGGEAARLRWGPRPAEDENGAAPPSPWELDAEPDWGRLDSIRLVSALFDDGAALGAAALRPRDARGHDSDVVVARLANAEGEQTEPSEALVSVEFDAQGEPRRLGMELWMDPDSTPLRVAADRAGEAGTRSGRGSVPMRFRLDGTGGAGLYEILRPA